ncbi:MAG: hypothetical protein QW074_08255 [Candidatus Caldarchaeum sp.]
MIDESEVLISEIARLKKFIAIAEDGAVLLKFYTDIALYKVLAYMIGKLVVAKIKTDATPSLTLGDLAVLSGLRGSDLQSLVDRSKYIVYFGHGQYRFNTVHLREALEELEKAVSSE